MNELNQVASKFVEISQTGQLVNATNLTVSQIDLTPPAPVAVDLTGGVRATNETSMFCFVYTSLLPGDCV